MNDARSHVDAQQLRRLAAHEMHRVGGDRASFCQALGVVWQLLHAAGAVEYDASVACGDENGLRLCAVAIVGSCSV